MSVGFGRRLRKARENKEITQAELAKMLNLGESTISFYESGKREPNYGILADIARILNVSPTYLLTGDKEWWEKDEEPTEIELLDFIKKKSNIKLMGDPLDDDAKDDVMMFLRAAHQLIKEKRKANDGK